jgi:DNA polymerase-3 subunit epsilon
MYPILTPVPSHCRRALIFDVETTGLIPKPNPAKANPPRLTECPYIIQLSYVIFNIVSNRVEHAVNKYISIPDEIEISSRITEITGITREILTEKGVPIVQVLEQFYESYLKCDMVVAHNLDFDKSMVHIEIARNELAIHESPTAVCPMAYMSALFSSEFNTFNNIDLYCTMIATVDLCKIMAEYTPPPVITCDESGSHVTNTTIKKLPTRQYKKYPKLSELHNTLFGSVPENLHNALIDVMVCLRCFMKIRCCVDMPQTTFDRILRNVEKMTTSTSTSTNTKPNMDNP